MALLVLAGQIHFHLQNVNTWVTQGLRKTVKNEKLAQNLLIIGRQNMPQNFPDLLFML